MNSIQLYLTFLTKYIYANKKLSKYNKSNNIIRTIYYKMLFNIGTYVTFCLESNIKIYVSKSMTSIKPSYFHQNNYVFT